ncbi:iron-containing alcohol dehydrogenase [Seiridium cupressi]
MSTFEYIGAPYRVVFGTGTLQKQLLPLLEKLKVKSVAILSTPEQVSLAETTKGIVGAGVACIFSEATMHTPTHVTEKALEAIRASKADGIISVGGGSTIGLGKAISVRTGLPHLSVPTTYAGSEMTPILGETENGRKVTRRDPKILPDAVLYDVELTKTLPLKMSLHSGINAIAHSGKRPKSARIYQWETAYDLLIFVEALYASNRNPIVELMASESIRALSEALPALRQDSQDAGARYQALYGAWLCGHCLGSVDMALHHKLCHTLGGTFNLPHAETHVVMLPHAVAYNAPSCPEAMRKLAAALPDSGGDAVHGLNALYKRLGISFGLKDLGMPEAGIDEATTVAVSNPYKNPRPLEQAAIREIIRRAWAGEDAKAV